ncbi:FHIPEP family type III secretion protein [Escherichia coli]
MKYPDLLKEILRYITVQRISEVIQRLILERISVRNMRLVMEALALWSPREKDNHTCRACTRCIRSLHLPRKFSYLVEIKAIVISPEIEDRIRDGVRPTAGGTFLNLDASEAEMDLDNFKVALSAIIFLLKTLFYWICGYSSFYQKTY